MSYQALNWASKQRVGSPIGKSILNVLANYADEKGSCFPSHALLVRETELSDKSVRDHLDRLETLGVISATRDRDARGRLGLVRYILDLAGTYDIAPVEAKRPRKKIPPAVVEAAEPPAPPTAGPPAPGTAGPPAPGAGGEEPQIEASPPVRGAKSPPVRGTQVTLLKDNPLSQTLSPLPREEEQGERERIATTSGEEEQEEDPSLKLRLGSPPPTAAGDDPKAEPSVNLRLGSLATSFDPDGDEVFEALATLWPMKDKLAEAAELWEAMSVDDRAMAAAYAPHFLKETRAKRTMIEQLATFLRGKAWRFVKTPSGIVLTMRLKPFSREWWALFWRRLAAGERVSFMLAEAARGNDWPVEPAAAPTTGELQHLIAVPIVEHDYKRWTDYLRRYRLTVPAGAVIFAPDENPPGTDLLSLASEPAE